MPNRVARIDHKLKLKYFFKNRTTYRYAVCVEKKREMERGIRFPS